MLESETLPTIPAARVSLRWLTERDVPALFALFSDPEVTRYWSSPPMTDLAEARRLLDEIHDCYRRRSLFQWGVARSADDGVVGTCTLAQLDAANGRADVGYALARASWGQGIMNEALTALLDFAFGTLELRRIEADVDPRNAASMRTLERLGFQREGYLRERWCIAGEVQDTVLYGLLRREWRGRAAAGGR